VTSPPEARDRRRRRRHRASPAERREGRYERVVLTRGGTDPPGVASVRWSPEAAERGDEAELERLAAALDGAAAIVNLAGASIADGRLDDDHVRRLRASRVGPPRR
jgi:uncharacterized protein